MPQPQPEAGVTYAAKLAKSEARIDWSRDAASIDRQVRAFNPWPVAETRLDGEQLRIWRALPLPGRRRPRSPAPCSSACRRAPACGHRRRRARARAAAGRGPARGGRARFRQRTAPAGARLG
ncbi:MAG: hypothetical protein U1F06_05320 [Steroidobacteraceae bacterium]